MRFRLDDYPRRGLTPEELQQLRDAHGDDLDLSDVAVWAIPVRMSPFERGVGAKGDCEVN